MGGRRQLTRDKVVDAAVEIARTEGVSAVTMRRVGQALGVEAMSLYTWVANKDDLLTAMVERLHGPEIAQQLAVNPEDPDPVQDVSSAFAAALIAHATQPIPELARPVAELLAGAPQ